MKYVETKVTFSEVPDEISLCLSISGCEYQCVGCHSPHLQQDIGNELTLEILEELISIHKGITCICFLGGREWEVYDLAKKIKEKYNLKIAWYTGNSSLPSYYKLNVFNYIKLGGYSSYYGGLSSKTTNQRMYKIEDITYKFWKDDNNN